MRTLSADWMANTSKSESEMHSLQHGGEESKGNEFQLIHELCLYVLSASQRTELIRATLSTLHAFLSWIPLGYIFESPLVCALLDRWLLYCL